MQDESWHSGTLANHLLTVGDQQIILRRVETSVRLLYDAKSLSSKIDYKGVYGAEGGI